MKRAKREARPRPIPIPQPFPEPAELTDPSDSAREEVWTPFACAALSLGKDPRSIDYDLFEKPSEYLQTEFSIEFGRRYNQIKTSLDVSNGLESHLERFQIEEDFLEIAVVYPIDFVRWCHRKEIQLAPDLIAAVERITGEHECIEVIALKEQIRELEAAIENNKGITSNKITDLAEERQAKAEKILKGLFSLPRPGLTKELAKKECKEKIPGLTGGEFIRAWNKDDVVPKEAKLPGAKPRG